jgi:hypothetical protein
VAAVLIKDLIEPLTENKIIFGGAAWCTKAAGV